MNPRLAAVLLTLVSVSLAALGWLGLRLAEDARDQAMAERRQLAEDYLLGSLSSLNRVLEDIVLQLRRDLESDRPRTPASWRELARRRPLIKQGFELDASGNLVFPRVGSDLTQAEREFLLRTGSVWTSGDRVDQLDSQEGDAANRGWGWRMWYWGAGPHFLLWERRGDGTAHGVEVDRMALFSRVIAEAPGAEGEWSPLPGAAVELANESGELMYRWGGFERSEDDAPLSVAPLPAPLNMWSLKYYADLDSGEPTSRSASALMGLGGLGIGLIGMAYYFYRASSREMRHARQRVSALNQVAHELKTPMTNVQLYAELALQDWESDPSSARDRVQVVQAEAERASRLTHDFMTFTRLENGRRHRDPQEVVPDAIIERVIGTQRPRLNAAGIEVLATLDAPDIRTLDADALERGLINLIDNAVKYGSTGGRLEVSSVCDASGLKVIVADNGPGIPWRLRERIFDPFFRRDQRLEQSQSGVGIGLSIARRLARESGGDLRLLKREEGAAFELRL